MVSLSVMPMACKRAIVRRRWLRAALALRCCVSTNYATICSAYLYEQRPPRAQRGTSMAVAVRTWQSVRPGFFPPMFQAELAQENVAQATEDQVPLDREILAHFKMIHPQFRLAVLEGAFDDPTGKGPPHQHLDRCRFRSIAEEVLDLLMVQGIAGHQQMKGTRGQSLLIRQVNHQPLDLPDHRSLAAVFDPVIL